MTLPSISNIMVSPVIMTGATGTVEVSVDKKAVTITAYNQNGQQLDRLVDRSRKPSADAIQHAIAGTGVCSIKVRLKVREIVGCNV